MLNEIAHIQVELMPVFYLNKAERKFRPYVAPGFSAGFALGKDPYMMKRFQSTIDAAVGIECSTAHFKFAPEFKSSWGVLSLFENDNFEGTGRYVYFSVKFYKA